MNYISILPVSTSDFYGISTVIAVSGCIHKCEGCWAKERGGWKYSAGQEFNEDAYQELSGHLSKSYVDNLVIQGGDGLVPRNFKDTMDLCKRVENDFPDKRIVVFTGYTYEEIKNDLLKSPILKCVDVLIDGKYDKNLPKSLYRGSENQRILWLQDGEIIQEE